MVDVAAVAASPFRSAGNSLRATSRFSRVSCALKTSPYAQKLDTPSLFLKALQVRAPQLAALLTAHLGNNLSENGTVTRMSALSTSGPALDMNKLDQIAALPLGGRVKMNGWSNRVELINSQPIAITSARAKMMFEVTPFFPRLTRAGQGDASTPGNANGSAQTASSAPAASSN